MSVFPACLFSLLLKICFIFSSFQEVSSWIYVWKKELVTGVPMLFLFSLCSKSRKQTMSPIRTICRWWSERQDCRCFSVVLKQASVGDRRAPFLATDATSFLRKRVQKISPSTYCLLMLSPWPQECMRGYTWNTVVYNVWWDSGQRLGAHKAGVLLERRGGGLWGWGWGWFESAAFCGKSQKDGSDGASHTILIPLFTVSMIQSPPVFSTERDNDPVLRPQVATAAVTLSYNCYQPV